MVKKIVLGIVVGSFLMAGTQGMEQPLPFDVPMSPGLDFAMLANQLKTHIRGYGPAQGTVSLLIQFYRLCTDNRSYCDKHFYREFAQLSMYELNSASYVACWYLDVQLRHKIGYSLQLSMEEVMSLENAYTNHSIITNFCNRMKGLAQ